MILPFAPAACRALTFALGCLLLVGLEASIGADRAAAQQAGQPEMLPTIGFSDGSGGLVSPLITLPGSAPSTNSPDTNSNADTSMAGGMPGGGAPAALVTPPPTQSDTPGAADPANTSPAESGLSPVPGLTAATPVVLELFTAEGCSSCLVADANLSSWARQRSVLVLTYHVDYWDYIGWRDMKAEPAFAQRQLGYVTAFGRNMVYTPQLIIGGSDESLGTDRERLAGMLSNGRYVAGMAPLRLLRDPQGHIFAELPAVTLAKPATIWLISYRRQVETDILAGENAGRHVSAVNVVRGVRKIGQWTGSAERLAVPIDQQAGGDIRADAAAVIANQAEYGPVIAATAVAFDSLR